MRVVVTMKGRVLAAANALDVALGPPVRHYGLVVAVGTAMSEVVVGCEPREVFGIESVTFHGAGAGRAIHAAASIAV